MQNNIKSNALRVATLIQKAFKSKSIRMGKKKWLHFEAMSIGAKNVTLNLFAPVAL